MTDFAEASVRHELRPDQAGVHDSQWPVKHLGPPLSLSGLLVLT